MGNRKKFWIFVLLTEIAYLYLYGIERIRTALGDEGLVLLDTSGFYVYITFILILASFFYIKTHDLIGKSQLWKNDILKASLLFIITLIFLWPIGTNDIFSYIYQSRIISHHNLNPYLNTYNSLSSDAFYYMLRNDWSGEVSIYGPFFMLLGSVLTKLAGNSLLLNIVTFKFVFAGLHIANMFLLRKITPSNKALFLYAANPLILFSFVANTHHDVLMIFLFLISLIFLFKKHSIPNIIFSWTFLALSVFVRFFSAIFIPFYIIYFMRKSHGISNKIITIFALVLSGLATTMLVYIPFWESVQIFTRYSDVLGYFTLESSPGIFILGIFLITPVGFSSFKAIKISSIINKYFFGLGYLILIVKSANDKLIIKRKVILKSFVVSIMFFYLTFLNWLMSWYLTLPITLLIISISANKKSAKYNRLLYAVTIYAIISEFMLH